MTGPIATSSDRDPATAPKVSVVIPHYRDLVGLERCLTALQRQTYPASDFEIIVADNNSPEGEAAVAKVVAGRAKLIVVTEKGAGPARNGAVAISRGETLAFIDSDCKAEPEWLTEGLRALPAYDFIGGRVTVIVDEPDKMTSAEAFERVFAFDFKSYITRKGFTGAGNLFCSRVMFDDVGPFRTGVSEDIEWSLRARGMGYRLGYAPRAIVGHPARRTWEELQTKWRRVNSERHTLSSEQSFGALRWLAQTVAVPLSAFAHTPRVLASDQLTNTRQRMLAISMLYRVRFWRFADALSLAFRGRGL